MSKRSKAPEPFPTGPAAHRKCDTCGERYHIYQFPYTDKRKTERGATCLGCVAEAETERLNSIRPR